MTARTMTTRTFLSVLVVIGVGLTACGSDDDASSSDTTSAPAAVVTAPETSPGTAPDTASPTTADAPAAEAATVMVASHETLGDYLVDAEGRTLYLFEQDQGTTTACTGQCAANWPPIVAEAPTAGEGVDASQLATADGIEPNQVTYFGHLLYYFAGDEAAGDTNGVGLPDWYAVSPAGEAIE